MEIKIERAHRTTTPKPVMATPRSIIVRFLNVTVKQVVLQQAWKQHEITFQDQKIYFDQDYPPDVQRKRKEVCGMIKKWKEINIRAQSPYPAQLFLDTGVKVFPSLWVAKPTLTELGINDEMEEWDILERELTQDVEDAEQWEEEVASSDPQGD